MLLERRSVFGWPATDAASAQPTKGIVIHYDGHDQGLAGRPHSACRDYWKRTRRMHMTGNGWADIGYSYAVCPHSRVLEGRGWGRAQAAQPNGNTTWYSITLMSGPREDPTPEQLNGVRELRAWLRGRGLGAACRGHRDFFATECPGDRLYRLVTTGVFSKPPGSEEDMPLTDEDVQAIWDRPMRGLRRDDAETHPAHYLLRLAEKNATEGRRAVDTEVTALRSEMTALRTDVSVLTGLVQQLLARSEPS